MQPIKCFLLEPTDKLRRSLRRFRYSEDLSCPVNGSGHDTSVPIEEGVEAGDGSSSGDLWPHSDPRWPTHCVCGYEFEATDEWQLSESRIWRRTDTGTEITLDHRTLEPGAMWWATWHGTESGSAMHKARGGGPHLHVMTPGGMWDIDAESSNGPGWERHGEPPHVTARPSILIYGNGGWHGWLTDGVLTEV